MEIGTIGSGDFAQMFVIEARIEPGSVNHD